MVWGTRCTHRRQKVIDGATYCDDARGRCGRIVQGASGRWMLASSAEKKGAMNPEGTCQVCFKQFKVPDGKLIALHGYQRPGDGAIHGRCWGAQYAPFEFEKARTEWYLGELEASEERKVARLAELQPPGPEMLVHRRSMMDFVGTPVARGAARVGIPYTRDWVPSYEEVREHQVREKEGELRMLRLHMSMVRGKIAAWMLKPLIPAGTPSAPSKTQIERQKAREARDAKRAEQVKRKAERRQKRIESVQPRVHVIGLGDGDVMVVQNQAYVYWPREKDMLTRGGGVAQMFLDTAPGILLVVTEFYKHVTHGEALQWEAYVDADALDWTPSGKLAAVQAAWAAWETRQEAQA